MEIADKILSYRDKVGSNYEELRLFLASLDPKQLLAACSFVEALSSKTGAELLNLCLMGCPSDRLKMSMMENALTCIMLDATLPYSTATLISTNLQMHLSIAGVAEAHLVGLMSFCVRSLFNSKTQRVLMPHWTPFLTSLLTHVVDKASIVDEDGIKLSGTEYRQKVLNHISKQPWPDQRAAQIVSVFVGIELSATEVNILLSKICSCLAKIEIDEMASMVYQCLRLVDRFQSECLRLVITLNGLFNAKLSQSNNSECFVAAVMESMSVTLFHILDLVKLGHCLGRKCVMFLSHCRHVPELLFQPFTLHLALILNSIRPLRQAVMQILKSATINCMATQNKRLDHGWIQTTVQKMPDVSKAFDSIIRSKRASECYSLVCDELIDLAFEFLDTSPGFCNGEQTEELWRVANTIFCDVLRHRPHDLARVIKLFSKRLMSAKGSRIQFTNCLRVIVERMTGDLCDCPSILNELLLGLTHMDIGVATQVLSSVLPLVKASRTFRDMVISVLRKQIFASKPETRSVAVAGITQLLNQFQLSSSLSVTQMLSQSQSGSMFQLTADSRGSKALSNDAVCSELVGVLNRCFNQPTVVKLTLYRRVYDIVLCNSGLSPLVLNIFYHHLNSLNLGRGEDNLNPIDMSRFVLQQNGQPLITEPIGWLLHTVQLIIGNAQKIMTGHDESMVVNKLVLFFDELCEKMSKLDLSDLDIEKNADYNRASVDGNTNALQVDCYRNVYEALMEYTIVHGVQDCIDRARILLQLFRVHKDLSNLVKAGKVAGQKKDDTKVKISVSKKVTLPENAFSWKALIVVLRMLLLDKSPSHQDSVQILRQCEDFTQYIMKLSVEKLQFLDKAMVLSELKTDLTFRHVTQMASIMFTYSFRDQETTVNPFLPMVVEILQKSFIIANTHFRCRLSTFFSKIVQEKSGCTLVSLMDCIIDKFKALKSLPEDEHAVKTSCKIIGFIRLPLAGILSRSTTDSPTIAQYSIKLADWCRQLVKQMVSPPTELMKASLDLAMHLDMLFSTHAQFSVELSRAIHSRVGDLDASVAMEEMDELKFITSTTGDTVYQMMVSNVRQHLIASEMVLSRIKAMRSHVNCIPMQISDSQQGPSLSERESSLCHFLARLVNSLLELVQTGVSQRQSFDLMFKLLSKFYTHALALTRHYLIRCKTFKEAVQVSRFDWLVTNINRDLTPKVHSFITYATDEVEQRNGRRKGKKRTGLIPSLTFNMESFEKYLLKLERYYKFGLLKGFKPASGRDFRIAAARAPAQPNLGDEDPETDVDDDNEQLGPDGHAAESTRIDSQDIGLSVAGSDDDRSSQPSKKRQRW